VTRIATVVEGGTQIWKVGDGREDLTFFFSVLGFEPRAFTSSFHQSFFVKGFYEIGSHELFAQGWL
jgi:hypothetical protein